MMRWWLVSMLLALATIPAGTVAGRRAPEGSTSLQTNTITKTTARTPALGDQKNFGTIGGLGGFSGVGSGGLPFGGGGAGVGGFGNLGGGGFGNLGSGIGGVFGGMIPGVGGAVGGGPAVCRQCP